MYFSQTVRLINLNRKWIPSVNCFDRCGIHIFKEQFRPDKFSQKCLRKNEINIFEGTNKTAKGPHSATMIILVDLPSSKGRDAIETSFLFTHRAAKMKNHANEISLPGGAIEKNESVEIAALRETEEEIGLDRSKLEIWGQLPSIIRPYNKGKTNPVVSRFIGDLATFESQLRPEEGEVQGIFLVPIMELVNSIRFTAFRIDGQLRGDLAMFYRMPAFIVSEFKVLYPSINEKYLPNRRLIWGLTAITIYEMLLSISQLNDLMMKHK